MRLPRLTELHRCQRGAVLPLAVTVLFVAGGLAAVSVTAAVRAQRGALNDRSVKRAIAAADAGVEVAVYRLNKFSGLLTPTSQCVATDGTGVLRTEGVQADGWCSAQTEQVGDDAYFSFRVSAPQTVNISGASYYQREIVSTGTVNSAVRRAHTTVNSSISGNPLFPNAGVASVAGLVLDSNSRIDGEAGSNGDIEVKSNARVCGDAHPGPGESFIGTDYCPGPPPGYSRAPAAQDFSLQQVTIPSTNDNSTLNGVSGWNSSQRRLVLDGSTQLTLTGNTYVFCYLEVNSNAILKVGTRTSANPLKIYLDSPANCNTSNEGSVLVNSNAQLENLNSDPTTFQLYLAGTPLGTAPRNNTPLTVENNPYNTWVSFDSNSLGTKMTIYAPNSEVRLNSNSTLTGAVAAARVRLDSNSRIIGDSRARDITAGSSIGLAARQSWVECTTSATGASPDSGC